MAAILITKTALADPPPIQGGQAKLRLFDTRTKGFIAEIRSSVTTFFFRYRDPRGRAREIKLGRLGDVTLEQARKRAEQLKAETSLGADPVAERAARRAVPTIATFVEQRFVPHVRDRLRSHKNVDSYVRRIVAAIGSKALDEVTPSDIDRLRQKLVTEKLSNATINRHLGCCRRIFSLAIKWGLLDGKNPAAAPGMLAEKGRDVYLTAAEVQALVKALDLEPNRARRPP